jgi:transposase
MSISKYSLIDVPSGDGVHTKIAGAKGEKYVYKYTQYFRNAEGKPRNRAILIGKLDAETGKMEPNSNYYELFKIALGMPDTAVWDYGYSYLVLKCCNDMGLTACLNEAFGVKAMDIIVAAAYIIREGSSMDAIDDWLERTLVPGYFKSLNSESTSRLFESIPPSKTHEFFKRWVAVTRTGENVCYDVTSISSYSRTMTDVEYGYNRDGEDLPQFNIGMFCDESSKLPLYFNRYNGSLTDKMNLSYVLENAGTVGLKDIKFVADGGFISEECIGNLSAYSKAFTIGIPAYLDVAGEMLKSHSQGIERFANKLSAKDIYCVDKYFEYYGASGRLMLFYDPMSHAQLCNEMSERIRSLSAELSALKRYPARRLKRYTQYFRITRHADDSGFDFAVDADKIDLLRQYKGFFLIFSTDNGISHDDALYHYRAKDAAEKLFYQLKVDMQGARIRTHNQQTTNGKAFVLFIALVIRTYIMGKLKKHLAEKSTSLKKVFNQLANITVITTGGKARFTKALTKEQKSILSAFNATDDILKSIETCLR